MLCYKKQNKVEEDKDKMGIRRTIKSSGQKLKE
jgi:hypothetical protein